MRILTLAFAFLLSAAAQNATTPVMPPIQLNFNINDLKAYLSLTDAQVQSLQAVEQSLQQARTAVYQQIAQKQQQLNALLQAGSTDATTIGQLTIDIHNLSKQVPVSGDPYRTQALAVLNPDQKNKLPALATALQLQSTAYQAVTVNLIDGPKYNVLPLNPGGPITPVLTLSPGSTVTSVLTSNPQE